MSEGFLVPIARPFIGEEEKREVLAVLESGRLVQGEWVERLEQTFAELHGSRFAVATSSGTTALTAALMAHGIGPGDEVIVPAFSFFATASSVLSVHARPVFADVDPSTCTLSAESAEAAVSSRTRAILPVHLYGHPADMPALSALCERRGLVLLEDAAQAHLASIDGRCVGTFGTGAFSMYASKNATTGEGGIVLTSDEAIAERLRRIRNHGRSRVDDHDTLGFNFRLTNLAAALGLPQLARLPAWTAARIAHASFYREHLLGVARPTVRPQHRHVFHQYTVRAESEQARDRLVAGLHQAGIEARVYYPRPIHRQPIMRALGLGNVELPVTDELCRTVLSLPVHSQLTRAELELVVATVNRLTQA
jgi:perosamine synthetase